MALGVIASFTLSACNMLKDRDAFTYHDANSVNTIFASVETDSVNTEGDSADDPAIWIHPDDPEQSLIIGTNKKSGLAVYDLSGKQIQFLEYGLPNNVDLRQDVKFFGESEDLGAFSDRMDNTVGWISINDGKIAFTRKFAVKEEPYGFCLGKSEQSLFAFVTYKSGLVEQYELVKNESVFNMPLRDSFKLETQLEGCVYDDSRNRLFVGEEAKGVWIFDNASETLVNPILIDEVGSENGIVADIEGIALYHSEEPKLFVSSQGNDSFAVYEALPPYSFIKRFRISAGTAVDGAQETDGIEVTNISLKNYPNGFIVAQDGFNDDGNQNFKIAPLPHSAQ